MDKINLTIKQLKNNTYVNLLSKDFSIDKDRFYLTTPQPLLDGYYQVTLMANDKANNQTRSIFYLNLNTKLKSKPKVKTKVITVKPTLKPVVQTVTETVNVAKDKVTKQVEYYQKELNPTKRQVCFLWWCW